MKATPYRQPIEPGDVGADVLAVKRAFRAMKAPQIGRVKLDRRAGGAFVDVVRSVQGLHRLPVTGHYGPLTHAVVAPHFDLYGVALYRAATIRAHALYTNPFFRASIQVGRIDQGVDFHGFGPICAIGDGEVVGLGGQGWPGGHYLLYQLRSGPHAGRYVFVAEAIIPVVRAGQRVSAGQELARFGPDAHPGRFPGIETGWGSHVLNLTYAATTTGYREGEQTKAGLAFARLLRDLGVPDLDPGPGPTFP